MPASQTATAIFMGAGASKGFAYPLTGELLPAIVDQLHSRKLFSSSMNREDENAQDRQLLHEAVDELLPGLASVPEDQWPLITSILSLLDYSLSTGQTLFRKYSLDRIRRVRRLFEHALVDVLFADPEPTQQTIETAGAFERWTEQVSAQGAIGFITTNYDLSIERQLFRKTGRTCAEIAEKIDFGFTWRDPGTTSETFYPRPKTPEHRLHKLHGSLNWLRCALCGNCYMNPYGNIASQSFRRRLDDFNTCHCGHAPLDVQLVSPSFVRPLIEPNSQEIWLSATQILREADRWYIIGYSFPDEDLAIRSLFNRAFQARKDPPEIHAVQFGTGHECRYKAFFPSEKLHYHPEGFAAWLNQL